MLAPCGRSPLLLLSAAPTTRLLHGFTATASFPAVLAEHIGSSTSQPSSRAISGVAVVVDAIEVASAESFSEGKVDGATDLA